MALLRTICAILCYAAASEKPNFVVLFVDDMGLNQIAIDHSLYNGKLYGYTGDNGTISTPNVARLAAEGRVFQTWYSSFHVCSPSRASMMTGRLSVRSGIGVPCGKARQCRGSGGNQVFTAEAVGGLPLNETTTAEALRSAGYATMMLGKWHLGQRKEFLPSSRGFDHYLGLPASQDMGGSAWEPVAREPYQPVPLPLLNGTTVVEQPVDLGTLTMKYAAAAKNFIQTASQPFYLYMALSHIHAPNSAGKDFCGKSPRGAVGDATEEADWLIGEIMDVLRKRGKDDTLVFFTSDNGAPLGNDQLGNKPLRGGKAQVWEGGFREPGIGWGRGVVPGLTQAIGSTMDIHTTLLTQAGIQLPKDRTFDGIDLTKVLAGETEEGHQCYPFYKTPDSRNAKNGLAAARCGDFKAYWETDGVAPPKPHRGGLQDPPLLFDLQTDPGEDSPLDPNSAAYKNAMSKILQYRESHLASVEIIPDQMALGSDPQYAICSKPGSTPINCSSTPENWAPASVCQTPACLQRNSNLKKSCSKMRQEMVV